MRTNPEGEGNAVVTDEPSTEQRRLAGLAALQRLWVVAQRDTGQSGVIARFLLGLYNGNRFPFDLTDLRRLDTALFLDCMAVLQCDAAHVFEQEVHLFFPNGGQRFERLAEDWGMVEIFMLKACARDLVRNGLMTGYTEEARAEGVAILKRALQWRDERDEEN
jgi:hypothetical protein